MTLKLRESIMHDAESVNGKSEVEIAYEGIMASMTKGATKETVQEFKTLTAKIAESYRMHREAIIAADKNFNFEDHGDLYLAVLVTAFAYAIPEIKNEDADMWNSLRFKMWKERDAAAKS